MKIRYAMLSVASLLAACISVQQTPQSVPTPAFSPPSATGVSVATAATEVPQASRAPSASSQAPWTPPAILFVSPSPTPAPPEGSVITALPELSPTPVLTTSFLQIQPGVKKLIRPLGIVSAYGYSDNRLGPCNIAPYAALPYSLAVEFRPVDRQYFSPNECPTSTCEDDALVARFILAVPEQSWKFHSTGPSRNTYVGGGYYRMQYSPTARNDFDASINSTSRTVTYDASKHVISFSEPGASTPLTMSVSPEVGDVVFPPQHDAVNHLTTSAVLGRGIAYVTVSEGKKFSLIWADTAEQFWHKTPLDFAGWVDPEIAYPELVFLQGSTPLADQLAILDWSSKYECDAHRLYLVDTSWISGHTVLAVTLARQLIALGGANPIF